MDADFPLFLSPHFDDITDSNYLLDKVRNAGLTIVHTNGCFDLMHPGHIYSLYKASTLGDFLIVGVNSDKSVMNLKGDSRPILSLYSRVSILGALKPVSMTYTIYDKDPSSYIELIRPDVHVKGKDYKVKEMAEYAVCEEVGCRIELIDIKGEYSTSSLVTDIVRSVIYESEVRRIKGSYYEKEN